MGGGFGRRGLTTKMVGKKIAKWLPQLNAEKFQFPKTIYLLKSNTQLYSIWLYII